MDEPPRLEPAVLVTENLPAALFRVGAPREPWLPLPVAHDVGEPLCILMEKGAMARLKIDLPEIVPAGIAAVEPGKNFAGQIAR